MDDMLSLAGKTTLITGGASGMGRAAALLFAAHGARVVIVDRNGAAGNELTAEIRSQGGAAEIHEVDLSDPQALDQFLEVFTSSHEVLDVLFNHAGLPGPPGLEYDAASWSACMTLNVWVPMLLSKRLLPLLRKSGSASIVCTSSIAGIKAVAQLPTYAASKAALNQFVKSFALMVAPQGIRINAICPGATDTPALRRDIGDGTLSATLEAIAASVPLRRLGTSEDIASMALFLASDASRFITGTTIAIDGGMTA